MSVANKKETGISTMMFTSFCKNDETKIFEAIVSLCASHGMPKENIPGFVMKLIEVINRWSEMIHQA